MVVYFRFVNKLLPNGDIAKYFDGLGRLILESRLSGSDRFNQDETLRGENLITALTRVLELRPLGTGKNQKISLIYESSDFLPFEFLERGVRCGKAVCCLKQKFSADSIEPVIQVIQGRKYSKADLDEIFLTDFSSVFPKDEVTQQGLEPFKALGDEEIKKHFIEKAIVKPVPIATGFLVGKDYLLTNYHVLFDQKKVEELKPEGVQAIIDAFTADFQYEQGNERGDRQPVSYSLDSLVYANQALDYALIKVKRLTKDELNEINKNRTHELTFKEAGNNFGWLKLQPDAEVCPLIQRSCLKDIIKQLSDSNEQEKPLKATLEGLKMWDFPGEPVNIIQHPQGRYKEITVFNNRVQELYKNFLQYEADADLGSSGSPVFNAQWQLVGIHHAALIAELQWYDPILNLFRFFLRQPRLKAPLNNQPRIQVAGQLGIRASQIWADLEAKQKDPACPEQAKIATFWKKAIEPRPRYVFLLAGRDRTSVLGKADAAKEVRLMNLLKEQIEAEFQSLPTGSQERVKCVLVPLPDIAKDSPMDDIEQKACSAIQDEPAATPEKQQLQELKLQECRIQMKAIQWINDPKVARAEFNNDVLAGYEYEVGDVALELVMDHRPETPDTRGVKAYYFRSSEERRNNAELLLRLLTSAITSPPDGLPNRGAVSDSTVSRTGLRFCTKVWMPALVLYVGYLTNKADKELLDSEAGRAQVAKGIFQGLEGWVNSLSPNFDPDRYIQKRPKLPE